MNDKEAATVRKLLESLGVKLPTDQEFWSDANEELDNLIKSIGDHESKHPELYQHSALPQSLRHLAGTFYEYTRDDANLHALYMTLFGLAVLRLMGKTEAPFDGLTFTAHDWCEITGRGKVASINGIEGFDPKLLTGKEVTIDGHRYMVRGVELAGTNNVGKAFGLLVKELETVGVQQE